MAEKKKAIHTGHRGRVKEEFLTRGVEGWPDHRIVELLLFYAIPQGDVNPLAHELVDRFGSLEGVLDALPEELMKVKGMGEHSVTGGHRPLSGGPHRAGDHHPHRSGGRACPDPLFLRGAQRDGLYTVPGCQGEAAWGQENFRGQQHQLRRDHPPGGRGMPGVRLVDHLVFVDGDLVSIQETATSGRGGFRMIYPGQW